MESQIEKNMKKREKKKTDESSIAQEGRPDVLNS